MSKLIDVAKGKIKQVAGKLTGNKSLERRGKVDEVKGKVKGAMRNAKKSVKRATKR
jgi:uncharacterized protein YjbJ (UPF0337 family)